MTHPPQHMKNTTYCHRSPGILYRSWLLWLQHRGKSNRSIDPPVPRNILKCLIDLNLAHELLIVWATRSSKGSEASSPRKRLNAPTRSHSAAERHTIKCQHHTRRITMAVGEQVYGFFIPTVTLMGIGAHKELGLRVKTLGGKKPRQTASGRVAVHSPRR